LLVFLLSHLRCTNPWVSNELSSRTAWLWRWRIYDLSHVSKLLHSVTRCRPSFSLTLLLAVSVLRRIQNDARFWLVSFINGKFLPSSLVIKTRRIDNFAFLLNDPSILEARDWTWLAVGVLWIRLRSWLLWRVFCLETCTVSNVNKSRACASLRGENCWEMPDFCSDIYVKSMFWALSRGLTVCWKQRVCVGGVPLV
jgi:hypothetical protein